MRPTRTGSVASYASSITPYPVSGNYPARRRLTLNPPLPFFILFFFSDVVVQDGYQSVLNLRTVLKLISARHARITKCARETDGATSYNSVFVALFSLQLGQGGKSGTIRIVQHGHNEPGHGSDICDTAGNDTRTSVCC